MTQEELKALYDKQNTAEGYSAQQKLERLASKMSNVAGSIIAPNTVTVMINERTGNRTYHRKDR